MADRNDCMIVNALEAMAHVMADANITLQANHNQQAKGGEFCELSRF